MQKIINGLLDGVPFIASPNFNDRPKDSAISLLIIHNISLPPGEFANGAINDFFLNRLDATSHPYFATIAEQQVSAHLLIDRNGKITQYVRFDQRAWHAGVSSFAGRENCNDYALGIELEGTDNLAYTTAQYQALVEVSIILMREYPAITQQRIVGHCDVAPQRKTDPGAAFAWENYFSLLKDGS